MSDLNETDRQLLNLLESGEKTAGELLDGSSFKSYPALLDRLKSLADRELITLHWSEQGSRIYRLARASPAPFWMPKN